MYDIKTKDKIATFIKTENSHRHSLRTRRRRRRHTPTLLRVRDRFFHDLKSSEAIVHFVPRLKTTVHTNQSQFKTF